MCNYIFTCERYWQANILESSVKFNQTHLVFFLPQSTQRDRLTPISNDDYKVIFVWKRPLFTSHFFIDKKCNKVNNVILLKWKSIFQRENSNEKELTFNFKINRIKLFHNIVKFYFQGRINYITCKFCNQPMLTWLS